MHNEKTWFLKIVKNGVICFCKQYYIEYNVILKDKKGHNPKRNVLKPKMKTENSNWNEMKLDKINITKKIYKST